LKDSPSLKRYLSNEWLVELYDNAKLDAFKETGLPFPSTCPYDIEDVLNRSILLSKK
jgi:hypothetical protein